MPKDSFVSIFEESGLFVQPKPKSKEEEKKEKDKKGGQLPSDDVFDVFVEQDVLQAIASVSSF